MSAETADHYQAVVAHDPSQNVFINGWMARAQRLADLAEDEGLVRVEPGIGFYVREPADGANGGAR